MDSHGPTKRRALIRVEFVLRTSLSALHGQGCLQYELVNLSLTKY
jgi:hypothetical protein